MKLKTVTVASALVLAGLQGAGAGAQGTGPWASGFGGTLQSVPAVRLASEGICGWYVILGCSRTLHEAQLTLGRLGGPGVGGWAGAQVVDTSDYPNFRNGWYCVADGPYPARFEAESIAWREAVPDAYVKSGC